MVAAGYDIAHLLGAGVLLMSFVLLTRRRLDAMITAFAAQGALLAVAAAWQGYVQGSPGLFGTAAMALVAKAVLIPLALRLLLRRLGFPARADPALGIAACIGWGVALVGLAVLVVLPATAGEAHALARENLALALSVVLLGMLMMIARRNALGQAIGLLSLENGLILGAVGVAGLPWVLELSTAALVLMLALVAGIVVVQLRHRLDTLDTSLLDAQRGEPEA